MKKELPSGWQEFQIKDICSINYGKGLGKNNIVEGNIPVYSSGGIIGYHNESLINSKGVIIGRKGNAGSVFYSNSPFFCIDTAFYVEANDNIDLKFLYYKLISIKLERHKIDSAVPGINRDTIYSISITIPPIDEQKRIADILSTFDDLIENLTKLIEKKELYKKGVMQRVLSGKVRFEGFTDEWETYKFEDIFIRIAGKKYQINQNEYKEIGKHPVIDQGKKYITAYSDNADKVFNNDNIIVFGDHTRIFKYVDFNFIIGADGVQLLKTNKEFDTKFMYYNLSNQYIPNTGYNRHFKFILDMSFYIPPSIEEQNKIAELLTLIDKDIEILKRLLHLRKLQKKGVMQKLLTGEVRI